MIQSANDRCPKDIRIENKQGRLNYCCYCSARSGDTVVDVPVVPLNVPRCLLPLKCALSPDTSRHSLTRMSFELY
ncbi:unnamed protein product [Cercopithifilaria johnstoni]|uniref:Uncharacterized protein n=1 Tax=Cercopithifilaria johnstoni TaxID=2874296 RepID=A0A8J2MI14_9BILA|nr:unnamed protein product [Cercopithifilaria johnstoni]